MKLYLKIALLLLLPVFSNAQMNLYWEVWNNEQLDSLRLIWQNTTNDTLRMAAARSFVIYYSERNRDSGLYVNSFPKALTMKFSPPLPKYLQNAFGAALLY